MIEVDCSPFKVLNELIQLKKVLNDLGRWAFYIVPFFGGATTWCATLITQISILYFQP